jgi:hypothetical protein
MRRETVIRVGRALAVLVAWSLVLAPLSVLLPSWLLFAGTLAVIGVAVSIGLDRGPRDRYPRE